MHLSTLSAAPKGTVPGKVKTLWVLGNPRKPMTNAKTQEHICLFVTCNHSGLCLKKQTKVTTKKGKEVPRKVVPFTEKLDFCCTLAKSLLDWPGLNHATLGLILIICRVGNWGDYIGRSQGKRDKQVTWATSAKLNWEGEGTMSTGRDPVT